MSLTPNEQALMRAILDSEYGEDPTDEVWTKYMAHDSGIAPTSLPGVMASLVKKGFAETGAHGWSKDDDTCNLTEAGVEAFRALGIPTRKLPVVTA